MLPDQITFKWMPLTSSFLCGVRSGKSTSRHICFPTSICWSWDEGSWGFSEHRHIGGSVWKLLRKLFQRPHLMILPCVAAAVTCPVFPNNDTRCCCTDSVFRGSGQDYAGKTSDFKQRHQSCSNRPESFLCRSASHRAKCCMPGTKRVY